MAIAIEQGGVKFPRVGKIVDVADIKSGIKSGFIVGGRAFWELWPGFRPDNFSKPFPASFRAQASVSEIRHIAIRIRNIDQVVEGKTSIIFPAREASKHIAIKPENCLLVTCQPTPINGVPAGK